LVHYLQQLL